MNTYVLIGLFLFSNMSDLNGANLSASNNADGFKQSDIKESLTTSSNKDKQEEPKKLWQSFGIGTTIVQWAQMPLKNQLKILKLCGRNIENDIAVIEQYGVMSTNPDDRFLRENEMCTGNHSEDLIRITINELVQKREREKNKVDDLKSALRCVVAPIIVVGAIGAVATSLYKYGYFDFSTHSHN